MIQCSTINSHGRRCARPVVPGTVHCTFHATNIVAGNYRDGKYVVGMPDKLLSRFTAVLSDPELVSLTHDMALIQARISELVASLRVGDSLALWDSLMAAWENFLRLYRANVDPLSMDAAISEVSATIEHGRSERLTWAEIAAMVEQNRKLVESEQKRLQVERALVPVDQVMVLLNILLQSVERNVTDQQAYGRIAGDFANLINVDYTPPIKHGGRVLPVRSVQEDVQE